MEKNKAIVKIGKKEYIIMSSDPQEYILSVANEFNERLSELAKTNSALNPERLTTLAALNLCDDYMRVCKTNDALQQQITSCTEQIEQYKANGVSGENVGALKSELEEANVKVKLLEEKLAAKDDEESNISEKADEAKQKLEDEKNQLEKEIDDLKDELKAEKEKLKTCEENSDKLKQELEKSKEQIKLLESKLSDDSEQNGEIEDLKKKLKETCDERDSIKAECEQKLKKMSDEYAAKEKEFLDMIDNM